MESNNKIVWQALGTQGKAYGDTALEAATAYYAAYPNAKKAITVHQVESYEFEGIPFVRTIFGKGSGKVHQNVTKKTYKELGV